MKSQILNKNDKLLVTQEFLDNLSNRHICHALVWRLGETIKVTELSEYSTVKVMSGIWSTWIDNDLAESMYNAYQYEIKTGWSWVKRK